MAYTLTSEELIEQAKMLTTKLDSTTNPNMTYSSIASRNLGLNTSYYSGNNTTIVNILNTTGKNISTHENNINNFGKKINEILGDTSKTEMAEKFANLQQLMGRDTIIEGLIDMYSKNIVTEENVTNIVNENLETAIIEKLCWENNVDI